MSNLLNCLYMEYNIDNLPYGSSSDALGEVYEEFIEYIFKDISTLKSWAPGSLEYSIAYNLLNEHLKLDIKSNIREISSSRKNIPPTEKGGTPKTDVYLNITLANFEVLLVPLNIKQSTVDKVSFAEYDVDTIVSVLNIDNQYLISLLKKHQVDASAKNFTPSEKKDLINLLEPYARNLVRWCITLSPCSTSQDIRYPEYVIRFCLYHPSNGINLANKFKDVYIYNIEEYIDKIMLNNKGNLKKGGFGTGLSWTYATGSKGKKIQFKA